MIAYIDSSVVLRLVLGQTERLPEWPRVREAIASALVEVECLRTLDRLRLTRGIGESDLVDRREAVFRLVGEFTVVDVSRTILSRASHPLPTPLGTLDAIHLTTALAWRERQCPDLVLATHDAALGMSARACGMHVVGC